LFFILQKNKADPQASYLVDTIFIFLAVTINIVAISIACEENESVLQTLLVRNFVLFGLYFKLLKIFFLRWRWL